jgi:hypothetical protein
MEQCWGGGYCSDRLPVPGRLRRWGVPSGLGVPRWGVALAGLGGGGRWLG